MDPQRAAQLMIERVTTGQMSRETASQHCTDMVRTALLGKSRAPFGPEELMQIAQLVRDGLGLPVTVVQTQEEWEQITAARR